MKYKHLLVGVDFSPCSADALKEAVRLASYDHAQVTVVHVLDEEVLSFLKSHTVLDDAQTRAEACTRLEQFVNTHADGYERLETNLVEGHPFAALVTAAKNTEADLLLLGSRGHGDDERYVGSIASKCIRKAPLPVLLVQDRNGQSFQQVVCCVDYSPTSSRALHEAIRIAKLEHAALDFVHIYASPNAYQDANAGYMITGFTSPDDFRKQMKQNLENFLFKFEDEMQGIEVTRSVVDRIGAGRGIADHVRDMKGDLLVLGTRGRTGWKKLLLGTTAEHVIHRVACSTLTVKPDGFRYQLD